MTYCTLQDLIIRFGDGELIALTDDAGTSAIDVPVVDQILADTSARIDGYLTDRYALPLAVVPAALVPVACDLAHYLLASRNGQRIATDTVRQRYDDAISWLEKVAMGKFGLGLTSAGAELPSDRLARHTGQRRRFTGRHLRDFTDPHSW